MADEKRVPKIRFKGFEGEWELRKLSDLAENTYGGGTPATSNVSFWNGDIPWIQSSDLKDGIVFGVMPSKYISKDAIKKSAAKSVPGNSIAVVTRVGVGKLSFMPYSYSTSQDFLSLSCLKTEPYFTVYSCYKKINSEINAVQGTSIKGITKEELLDKQISIPTYDEQTHIGFYFQILDKTISKYQQKYESLQHLKETMLEKMFPKDGADVPEIRFKGFSGAWTNYNFKEVFSYLSNNTLSRADLEFRDGGVYDIHYGDILVKYNEILNLDSDEVPVIISKDYDVPKSMQLMDGDIIIADTAEDETVGKCTELRNINCKLVVSGLHTIPCRSKKQFASGYLGYYMNSPSYHNQLKMLMQGTKVSSISKSGLSDRTQISCPDTVSEQNKIVQFFDSLNNKIASQKTELHKLHTLKKSLLEKMFV